MRNTILCIVVAVLSLIEGTAKTVTWSVYPKYEEIKPYAEDMYLAKDNATWGLISAKGKELLPCQYNFITTPVNGVGLFGNIIDNRYRLSGIVKTDGTIIKTESPLYLTKYRFFSDGKMPVSDEKGLVGYINDKGKLVVKCQFLEGLPFSEGLAAVKNKGGLFTSWLMYITDGYDRNPEYNVLPIDFADGEIIEGTTFKNNTAVVKSLGGKYAIIDHSGKKKKGFPAANYRVNPADGTIDDSTDGIKIVKNVYKPEVDESITIYESDPYVGYTEGNRPILKPVLNSSTEFTKAGYAVAKYKNRMGIMKLIPFDYSSTLTSNTDDNSSYLTDQDNENIRYELDVPVGVDRDRISIIAKSGKGEAKDVTDALKIEDNKIYFDFIPNLADGQEKLDLSFNVKYDGLDVYEYSKTLPVEYPQTLRVSAPHTLSAKANERNDIQYVGTTISNDSKRPVTIEVVITVNCSGNNKCSGTTTTITINPGESSTVSTAVSVFDPQTASATVRLTDRKEGASGKVNLVPAY